ncbi:MULTISPECIES: hypothetical protein [Rhizobium]|uniref:hypothetical protein n=1 Tax=Rhizobium phaseoli TaxID=396 RepID=UPI000A1C06A3|nr:hypothetical protein [Rhizobium phaseoli]ARM15931.1 hypothetical protein Bra5_PD00387 [Rhizobium phaseoli Brasil 5]
MATLDRHNTRNLLLKALPVEANLIVFNAQTIELPVKHILVDRPNEHVCFIEDGLASIGVPEREYHRLIGLPIRRAPRSLS